MDAHELKAKCLALPGAVEDFPFGGEVSVFKVAGKMFALCDLDGDPLQLSIKCEPELAVRLRATYPAIAPGYHLNKRHWNTVTLDGSLPDQMVTDMVGDSYDLVVASLPKARRPAGCGRQSRRTSRRVAANSSGLPLPPYSPPRKPSWPPGKVTGGVPSRSATAMPARPASIRLDSAPTPMTMRHGAARSAAKSCR